MNVFVLCTGRCGSHTFIAAASHITNYTAGHETRCQMIGADRLDYPPNHVEADQRLSWFLGRLDKRFGPDAFYVHLTRDPEAVARSLLNKFNWQGAIAPAYRDAILLMTKESRFDCCVDYVETVNTNIQAFLKEKPHQMHFRLEAAQDNWPEFWERTGAEGDFAASLGEWSVRHDASPGPIKRAYKTAKTIGARTVRSALMLR